MGEFMPLGKMESQSFLKALITGKPKIGKTTVALNLALKGEKVFVFSVDRGLADPVREINQGTKRGKLYEKNIMAFDFFSDDLDLRDGERAIKKMVALIEKAKNTPHNKIWFVLDNLTHLQVKFVDQLRRYSFETKEKAESVVKDALTQLDWQVMSNWIMNICTPMFEAQCNTVFIAHEKTDKKGNPKLDVSGQSANIISGLTNANFHMAIMGGERKFELRNDGVSGIRSRVFDEVEVADLAKIRDKFLGL